MKERVACQQRFQKGGYARRFINGNNRVADGKSAPKSSLGSSLICGCVSRGRHGRVSNAVSNSRTNPFSRGVNISKNSCRQVGQSRLCNRCKIAESDNPSNCSRCVRRK